MPKNKNDDKFYLFKIDKDKIKLQLKDIGTKIIRRKNKRKKIAILFLFCLLIGVVIAVNYYKPGQLVKDNSEVIIESDNKEEQTAGEEQFSFKTNAEEKIAEDRFNLSSQELKLNKKANERLEQENMQEEKSQPASSKKNSQEVEGVVTTPVIPLKEKKDREIELLKPVSGENIRLAGWYYHPVFKDWRYQQGIELAGDPGEVVMAADSGKVITVKDDEYKGIVVIIKHNNGWKTLYGHLKRASVSSGEVIGKGQEIGRVGQSGISNEPSLYFELLNGGEIVNPEEYFE